MKNPYLIILFFVAAIGFSQSHGISYQAVLLNPKGEELPGQNNSYSPLLNKNVCLRFEIRNATNQLEYQETINTKTDAFGMVNLVIGTGNQTGGTAANFNALVWNTVPKKLVVALDAEGNCTAFIEISNQDFTGVPFAFSAKNAENVTGVVAIANGGTSATTAPVARVNLGLGNIDNTSDSNKPISIATQTALDLKEDKSNKSNTIVTDAASITKYPSVKAIKEYVDSKSSTGTLNYLPKFTTTTTMGNSNISDDGTLVNIATDIKIKGITLGVGPLSTGSSSNNLVFGKDAFKFNLSGISNIAIGNLALNKNTDGSDNIAIGISSLTKNETGIQNIAIGSRSLNNNIGGNNIGIGIETLGSLIGSDQTRIGDYNTSIGPFNLTSITNGAQNTAIGYQAGSFAGSGITPLTEINNSTFIGSNARAKNATNDTNEMVIGYNAVGLGSNTTVIGNEATVLTAFHGAYTNYESNNAASATTIDFSKSNIAYTDAPNSTITLTNLRDGGIYYLALIATSVTSAVTYTATGFTVKYMGTTARTSGKTHMYRFVVAGTTVFVSMEKEN